MKATLRKMGNSQGVLIPKAIVDQLGLVSELEMTVENGAIVLRPVVRSIRLTVVEHEDKTLSLKIRDEALGDVGEHFGSGRLQRNPDRGQFFEAVLDAVLDYKRHGERVELSNVQF